MKTATKGQFVKIERNRERFWVIITEKHENGYIGTVNNHLVNNPQKYGDVIFLQGKDILEIFDEGNYEDEIEASSKIGFNNIMEIKND